MIPIVSDTPTTSPNSVVPNPMAIRLYPYLTCSKFPDNTPIPASMNPALIPITPILCYLK